MNEGSNQDLKRALAVVAGYTATQILRNRRLRQHDRRAQNCVLIGGLGTLVLCLAGGEAYAGAFASGAGRGVWNDARQSLDAQNRKNLDPLANELLERMAS